jgi:hypothetical protein
MNKLDLSNRRYFLWLYRWNRARVMLGETREKFENHEP